MTPFIITISPIPPDSGSIGGGGGGVNCTVNILPYYEGLVKVTSVQPEKELWREPEPDKYNLAGNWNQIYKNKEVKI